MGKDIALLPCLLPPGGWSLSLHSAHEELKGEGPCEAGGGESAFGMGTGPHTRVWPPPVACVTDLPPATCQHEQTVSFYQPSLFSKHLGLKGRLAVSGPHQAGARVQLEGNKGVPEGGAGWLQVLTGAW